MALSCGLAQQAGLTVDTVEGLNNAVPTQVGDGGSCRKSRGGAYSSGMFSLKNAAMMRDAGHSVLFITHNIHHVFQVADRIVVMWQGEIVAELVVADTDLLTVESIITGADMSELMTSSRTK